ncbi:hypothetical protein [Polynucleobacter antarcticus]
MIFQGASQLGLNKHEILPYFFVSIVLVGTIGATSFCLPNNVLSYVGFGFMAVYFLVSLFISGGPKKQVKLYLQDLVPLGLLIIWVYGVTRGLYLGNEPSNIFRNFFGLVIYSAYFIFIALGLEVKRIYKVVITSTAMVCFVMYSVFIWDKAFSKYFYIGADFAQLSVRSYYSDNMTLLCGSLTLLSLGFMRRFLSFNALILIALNTFALLQITFSKPLLIYYALFLLFQIYIYVINFKNIYYRGIILIGLLVCLAIYPLKVEFSDNRYVAAFLGEIRITYFQDLFASSADAGRAPEEGQELRQLKMRSNKVLVANQSESNQEKVNDSASKDFLEAKHVKVLDPPKTFNSKSTSEKKEQITKSSAALEADSNLETLEMQSIELRRLQARYLKDEVEIFGSGLGARLKSGYKRDERGYGFESTYLNIAHKFGIFGVFILIAYLYTSFLIIKGFCKNKYCKFSAVSTTFFGGLIVALGNPIIFSPSFVMMHVITLYFFRPSSEA